MLASFRLGVNLTSYFGAHDEADAAYQTTLQIRRQSGNTGMEDNLQLYRASIAVLRGRTREALAALLPLESSLDASISEQAWLFVAQVYVRERRWDEALERSLRCQQSQAPWVRGLSAYLLACVYRARLQPTEALAALDRAPCEPQHGIQHSYETYLRVARAEAHYDLGQRDIALKMICDVRDRALQAAASFKDRALSAAYLTQYEPNVRAIALAAEWLGEAH
jgi:hypothetical protein